MSTIAGGSYHGFSGDGGPAISAQLESNLPSLSVSPFGAVFFTDTSNSVIRVIDTAGNINTAVGIGLTPGSSGDMGSPTAARLSSPYGVFVDINGVIYISDTWNNRIRKVY